MRTSELEIPYEGERSRRYRLFEILPGFLTWSILALPFILSIFSPVLGVWFIITYLLIWFVKSMGLTLRAIQGMGEINRHKKLNWKVMLEELEKGKVTTAEIIRPKWHFANLERQKTVPGAVMGEDIIHAVIIAAYNESMEILEPTIQSVLEVDYDLKKIILIIAYEERDGAKSEKPALALIEKYGSKFHYAQAIKHPMKPGEVRGKGGNVTHAGRILQKYLKANKIDPLKVIVTTLDSDNRPHPMYFSGLSYTYSLCPDPSKISFQPISMYTNNIWDAPAPMRVIATGNSFWNIVLALRPHILRNFSSHAQSMQTLIDTDFWSVRTIVEDGHQFWRTYFRYDGDHHVYPIFLPIYQDAVFASSYRKTLKAQFVQLRRWAWGASDIAYVADKGFFSDNNVPRRDLWFKFLRLLEGHITWAVAPLLLAFSAFIPHIFSPNDYASNQLPIIASRIQTIALIGIFGTLFLSLKTLPPKPKRYKAHRNLFMVIQWVYLPVTTILYNSASAIYSQTRLMFGKYLDNFDVTEKAAYTKDDKRVS